MAPTARLLLLLLPILASVPVQGRVVSVTRRGGTDDAPLLELQEGQHRDWLARSIYSDGTMEHGWAYLEVESQPWLPSGVQAYAAGLLEGFISHEIIYNSWRNTMEGYCKWKGAEFCASLRKFVRQNNDWMGVMIARHGAGDPLWYQVSLVYRQVHGLMDGYRNTTSPPIADEDFLWMNMLGDLEDLESVLTNSTKLQSVEGTGRCSALIKLLPGATDLYVSHVTWNSLQSMLRIQKKYILPYQSTKLTSGNETVPGHTVTFSSYPGIVHSADDYYLLSSGLLTMETTIGNSNPALWVDVKPVGELMEWVRVLVANRLAVDGGSWTKVFSKYNSGTYNNQWMVVDYKLFTPMKVIRPGTLWVLEQIPGLIVADDQSQHLQETSYWASYNVPFYPEVFNTSGIPALVAQYGDWFSYDKTPRALIFARDHTKVKDLGSMIKLMRYNDYKNDPLSKCECDPPFSAENGISARSDLNPKNGTYPFNSLGHRSHAGTDMKVTSFNLFHKLEFLAVSGPTHDQQPVFQWSKSDYENDTPHYGHPDAFEFPVVHKKWDW